MAKSKAATIQPDWISKTLAGALLGLGLAVAISGLFAWWGPGGLDAPNKVQFNMWVIPLYWMTVWSLVDLFRTGLRAWLVLGAVTAAAHVALFVTPQILGAS